MASGIAHDFNNTLTPILGFSELLISQPQRLENKEDTKRHLQVVNTAAKDAAAVVTRLRDFYRNREESETLEEVAINDIVAQAISLTQTKWKDEAQANNLQILVETHLQDVPLIYADPSELRQATMNLILNAVDAMPEGGSLSIKTRYEGRYVALDISDSGIGMTEEVRNRCLDPFFTTKGVGGTGMGLATVYGIVQRHQGSIDIESELGKGTTFKVQLPIGSRSSVKTNENGAKPESISILNVLVVDDEPSIRYLLAEYLKSEGHTIETADNGQQGLEKFRESSFDLVITDRAMPEMSGDQLAAQIKEENPDLPVIMLTGFGVFMQDNGDRPKGVDLVLKKPVTLPGLMEAIKTVVSS